MDDRRPERKTKVGVSALVLLASLYATGVTASLPPECGTLDNHYGPFDYRDPGSTRSIQIVEKAHFDTNVERLRTHSKCLRKKTCSSVRGDLAYTLRVFPNHHKALLSMVRYHLTGMNKSKGRMQYTAECYFRRAEEFRPDDPTVRLIHAYYLSETGRMEAAKGEYEVALSLAPDSAEVNYNAGLFFLDLNDIDKATECAVRAYELGHPLPGLRNRLSAKGVDLDAALP